MKGLAGMRDVQVLTGTTGTFSPQATYCEVTNSGGTDVIIYFNDFPGQGHPTANIPLKGIPVKAGTTREIPMSVYNFVASGAVTVVAYTA